METNSTPLQEIHSALLEKKGVRLLLKREDLIHPIISGNKYRKLKYNVIEAKKQGHSTLLTFGGAFSNHIYATAGAGTAFHFKTIGIIRGEEHLPLNPTLTFAKAQGMALHYLDRQRYRDKMSPEIIAQLQHKFGDFYLLPEGGTNALALQGCAEIIEEIIVDYDYLCCPVGTGGTISGLISGLKGKRKVIGFSALKGDFLQQEVKALLAEHDILNQDNWSIQSEYHFGGYAKVKPDLMAFIEAFEADHKIPLEPIYTGKMLFGIFDLIEKNHFEKGSTIVALHTGGLQGNVGFR